MLWQVWRASLCQLILELAEGVVKLETLKQPKVIAALFSQASHHVGYQLVATANATVSDFKLECTEPPQWHDQCSGALALNRVAL